MHIIADSGSSKTDWVLCQNEKIQMRFVTIGFNPYYYTSDVLQNIVDTQLLPSVKGMEIAQIYFYGSGCSSEQNQQIIADALKLGFKNASIQIFHDLLGAARSLFGNSTGISGIFGTGSNSGLYDGQNITHNIPSLGYFFGDDGSGSNLGKRFINDYLKAEIPIEIKEEFDRRFNYSFEYILNQIYSEGNPVKFFASLSPFIHEHIKEKYFKDLVTQAFSDFFRLNICKYPDYEKLPLKFIGSIAFIYADLLKEVAKSFDCEIMGIEKAPMNGLIKFHSSFID